MLDSAVQFLEIISEHSREKGARAIGPCNLILTGYHKKKFIAVQCVLGSGPLRIQNTHCKSSRFTTRFLSIICTNRDEYLTRPTTNAHFHSFDRPTESSVSVLSGRDDVGGGTWFGISKNGKVGLLTNITEPFASFPTSRGSLVASFLQDFSIEPKAYAGFNFITFVPLKDDQELISYDATFITNSGGGGLIKSRSLSANEKNIGSISNGIDGLDANEWPKVKMVQSLWSQLLSERSEGLKDESEFTRRLFELLTWRSVKPPCNRFQLRTSIQIPPILMTSSLAPDASADGPEYYGTRLATVLLIRRDGQVFYHERDIWQLDSAGNVISGDAHNDRIFRFRLNI